MITNIEPSKCCGCAACVNACPQHCIVMRPNTEGFLYPEVDAKSCVKCGQCEKACFMIVKSKEEPFAEEYWAIRAHDMDIVKHSSSGGVFYLLASEVLAHDGVVFGAWYAEDGTVKHTMVENLSDINLLCGSKYVQSDIGDCYRVIRQQLNQNKRVLFSGTPCQVSGLISFLGKHPRELLCVEVACHGVPSPLLLKKYVEYEGQKKKQTVSSVEFRNKVKGWRNYALALKLANGKTYYESKRESIYLRIFLKDIALRESCYQCETKGTESRADIILADFWGLTDTWSQFNDNKGTSLAITRTKAGSEALEEIKLKCIYQQITQQDAMKNNKSIRHSACRPPERDGFYKDLVSVPFNKIVSKYAFSNLKERLALIGWKLGVNEWVERMTRK